MIFKAVVVALLLLSVAQCDSGLTQISDSQASYDALVEAKQGAPSELVQVINNILAKFFPGKFARAAPPPPRVTPPTATATPAPANTPPTTPAVTATTAATPNATAAPVTTRLPVSTAMPATSGTPVTTKASVPTAMPLTSATPVTTQAPVSTAASSTSQAPVTTATPVTTAASATSQAPITTATPVTTAASQTSQAPVTPVTPVTSAAASTTQAPVTTAAPDTSAMPDTTPAPVTTNAPDTSAMPDTTPAPVTTLAPVIPPGCAGPAVALNFDDPIFDGQLSPTTALPVPLTTPFNYHGLQFTATSPASPGLALYNALLATNRAEVSLAGDSDSPPVFLVSRGGGFTVTTSTGRLQVISVFLSAPNLVGGAAQASISGTAATAAVPGCTQSQFFTTETGYPAQYAAGACVVDTLSFTTFGYAVGIDSLTVCTAAAPGTSSLTVTA